MKLTQFVWVVIAITGFSVQAGAEDCSFVRGLGVNAPVYRVQVDGCKVQYLARIFCASDHPEFTEKDEVTDADKFRLAEAVSCDAGPGKSAPTAGECMATVRDQKSRKGVRVRVAGSGPKSFVLDGVEEHAEYIDPQGVSPKTIFRFSFPPEEGKTAKQCRVCFAAVKLGQGMRLTNAACRTKVEDGCQNANDCADFDPTLQSIVSLRPKAGVRGEPASGRSEHGVPGAGNADPRVP